MNFRHNSAIQLALFADDVAAWTRGIKLSQIENRFQAQLNKIENWMSKWRTKLSTSKTTFLIFNKMDALTSIVLNLHTVTPGLR